MSTPIAPGWDEVCTPALHSVQVAEAREVYCGHGTSASYDMCVNYADRIRACDSCSICQCAKHCLDAVAGSVMLFQEDQSQPGPAGNQCYVYTSCTKGCMRGHHHVSMSEMSSGCLHRKFIVRCTVQGIPAKSQG